MMYFEGYVSVHFIVLFKKIKQYVKIITHLYYFKECKIKIDLQYELV